MNKQVNSMDLIEENIEKLAEYHKLEGNYAAFVVDLSDALRCGILETGYSKDRVLKDLFRVISDEEGWAEVGLL